MRRYFRPPGDLVLEPSAFFWLFDEPETPETVFRDDGIAVITVRGPLMQHRELFFESYEEVLGRVRDALAREPSAIVLSIQSPGGVCSGCYEAARELRALVTDAGVPLYAYVDGQATSGAYALACAAGKILTPPAAALGSIGVIAELVDAREAAAKWGVKTALVTSGARKADGHPQGGLTENVLGAVQTRVDELADMFFELVAETRGVAVDAVRALEARVMHGREAVELGLADRVVATFKEALASIASEVNGGSMEEDEQEARARLTKLAESDDEKVAGRAKRALAALDEDAGDDEEEATEGGGDDEDDKKQDDTDAAAATVSGRTAAELVAAVQAEARESEERTALLARRKDLSPGLVKVLEGKPLAEVRSIVDAIPKPKAPKLAAAAASTVKPTLGAGQGTAASAAVPSEIAALDRVMGRGPKGPAIREEAHAVSFGVMGREEAAEYAAKKGGTR